MVLGDLGRAALLLLPLLVLKVLEDLEEPLVLLVVNIRGR